MNIVISDTTVLNNDNLKIREAHKEDINSILLLVNRAYRSNHGWTNESSLVSGDRVEISEIIDYLENPKSHLFVLTLKEQVEACICIEELKGKAYIGFFAVNPNLQGQGIGKKLLTFSEDFAYKSLNLTHFKMAVLADRGELIDFYLRRGYQKTEQRKAYPKDLNVGTPKRENLTVIYLEKEWSN